MKNKYALEVNNNYNITPVKIATTSQITLKSTPFPTPIVSTDTVLPHEYLPGFNMTYDPSWKITFKQFFEKSDNGFKAKYFPSCNDRCMGIRLTKDDISVDFVFDLVFDATGERCSVAWNYKDIGNGWYRFYYDNYYFYDSNLEFFPLKNSDKNVLCLGSYGQDFMQTPNIPNTDGGILLEDPVIKGNPSQDQLEEIDHIITSITGIRKYELYNKNVQDKAGHDWVLDTSTK